MIYGQKERTNIRRTKLEYSSSLRNTRLHTSYIYFEEKSALMVFRRGGERRSVWNKVKFPEHKLVGTDSGWVKRCIRRGYRTYSVSKKHYVCIRRKNTKSHTQKKSTRSYMSHCRLVRRTKYFKRFVS